MTSKNIQIILWNYIMCLTGGQQGIDNRHINCYLMVAAEEVIFPSQSNRPDDIFSQIVIPEQASVLQTSHHVVPSGIGIRDGFPDLGIGAVLDSFRFHPHFHGIHDRSGQFPASGKYAVSGSGHVRQSPGFHPEPVQNDGGYASDS